MPPSEPPHAPPGQVLFEHACRNCGQLFCPAIDIRQRAILVAHCPHCGHVHGYDNRLGQLAELLYQRQRERATTVLPTQNRSLEYTTTATPFHEKVQVHTTAQVTAAEPPGPEVPEIAEPGHRHSAKKIKLPALRWPHLAVATALLLFSAFVALGVWQAVPMAEQDARELLAQLEARQSDVVLDRNGQELTRLGVAADHRATLSDFAPWQLDMLLFAEDRNFYEHHGVSYKAMLRALFYNLLHLRYAQGGSTITQQLARRLIGNRQKSLLRKIKEIRLARTLEQILPKQKILELYTNHVYLGHGNHSFAAAAQFYYGKTIPALTAAEFLSLVALIPAPEKLSPLKNNPQLLARMELLWQNLLHVGRAPVSDEIYRSQLSSVANQANRFASETAFGSKARSALWPTMWAREFLLQRGLLQPEHSNSARIHTTIDAGLQQKAYELVTQHLAAARRRFRGVLRAEDAAEQKLHRAIRTAAFDAGLLLEVGQIPFVYSNVESLQAALIALNPRTGEILAMVGGESFVSGNQLNRAVQMRRQTGSAIKPFIYAKAVQNRLIHPATLVDDTPYVADSSSKTWAPENIDGKFEGPIPVRQALARSRNIPAIRIGRLLGRKAVTELFLDFFFRDPEVLANRFSYDETVAIGTVSLSPLELARAFAVFANGGFLPDPLLITRLETAEKLLDLSKTHPDQFGLPLAKGDRLLSPAESQLMVSLLKSSGASAGTGVAGIIGKTGTSSQSRDLWFVGGGKEMVVVTWFGYDDMRIAIPGATGSALAARLAGDFLRKGFAPVPFHIGTGLVRLRICPLTGRLASENCPHAQNEIFLRDAVPEGECLHGNSEEKDFVAVMGESQFR
ncbi:MAG: transglycosylase domain-containing protein [Leptospiraceae bacterium]|nr:transglycosylase domain-containing protein [Leptospiraceae bacterium]